MPDSRSVLESFHHYFTISVADTPSLRLQVYKVRYRVYCEEFNYEPRESFPSHLETDDFDDDAVGALVIHRATGMPAACVRVIRAHYHPTIPLEFGAGHVVEKKYLDLLKNERTHCSEISRLAVDAAFRRRSGEQVTRFGEIDALDISQRERRTFGLLALAAMLTGISMTGLVGAPNMFAMMEPFLPRIQRRSGINFSKIGEEVDFHGMRAPYYADNTAVENELIDEARDLYDYIKDSIRTPLIRLLELNEQIAHMKGVTEISGSYTSTTNTNS